MSEELNDTIQLQNIATLGLINSFSGLDTNMKQFTLGVNTIGKALFDSSIFITRSIAVLGDTLGDNFRHFAKHISAVFDPLNKFGIALTMASATLKRSTKVHMDLTGHVLGHSINGMPGALEEVYADIRAGSKKGFENAAGAILGGGTGAVAKQKNPGMWDATLFKDFGKTFKTQLGLGQVGGMTSKLGAGPGKLLGGLMGGFKGATIGMGGAMMGGLKMLGPQMLALSLVMKPIGALLNGFLEPLDMITDIFGAFGEILGILLLPIMLELNKILLPLMPLLMSIVQALLPVIQILVFPLTLLAGIMQILVPIVTGFVNALGTITNFFGALWENVMSFFDRLFEPLISGLNAWSDGIGQGVSDIKQEVGSWF